jgi:hypothetical protein
LRRAINRPRQNNRFWAVADVLNDKAATTLDPKFQPNHDLGEEGGQPLKYKLRSHFLRGFVRACLWVAAKTISRGDAEAQMRNRIQFLSIPRPCVSVRGEKDGGRGRNGGRHGVQRWREVGSRVAFLTLFPCEAVFDSGRPD